MIMAHKYISIGLPKERLEKGIVTCSAGNHAVSSLHIMVSSCLYLE